MLRRQFETYLDTVFGFAELVAALPEGRKGPRHSWGQVFGSVFPGSACQFATLHRIEFESREGVLSKRIGPISVGHPRLRHAAPGHRFAACARLYDCAAFEQKRCRGLGVGHGRLVAAVDGIEICSSYARCGDICLER